MKIRHLGLELFMRNDGRTDMTTRIVAFRNFANGVSKQGLIDHDRSHKLLRPYGARVAMAAQRRLCGQHSNWRRCVVLEETW